MDKYEAGTSFGPLPGMKTIIALIIDPEQSRKFIKYSIQLSESLGSRLRLLYVEDPEPYPLGSMKLSGQALLEIQKSLKNKIRRTKNLLSKITEEVRLQLGSELRIEISGYIGKDQDILDKLIADKPDSCMVIVEDRESDSNWNKKDGTRGIMQSVECPVLVIPASSSFESFDKIVYVTDFQQEDISVMKSVIATMKPFHPQLTALHLSKDLDFETKVKQEGFQHLLEEITDYEMIRFESLAEDEGEDMATSINNYYRTSGADLIVLLKENTGFLQQIFNVSPTFKILNQVELPVLLYHQNNH
ncbi:MAG: universal stress protein [Bacteroidales bacterium]